MGEVELHPDDPGEGRIPGTDGKWRSFSDMTPEERKEMQVRSVAARAAKREARKLGELAAWQEANKDLAAAMFGTRLKILESLERKAQENGGEYDFSNLSPNEQKLLVTMLDKFDDRVYGPVAKKVQHEGQVDVLHKVAEARRRAASMPEIEGDVVEP
ncbi:MAG: hypothetical protein ACO3ND_10605 [Opitutales bacterium]